MRLIDADELMEHVWRDKLDSREAIAKMINDAQTVKDIPTKIPIDMFDQLMLERKAKEKDLEQKPIDMDMTKALILGLLLGIDKKPDEKDKLKDDLIKVFAPEQTKEVLDKIKEEIKQVSFTHYFECGGYLGEDTRQIRIVNFDAVMQIIDKYRGGNNTDGQ